MEVGGGGWNAAHPNGLTSDQTYDDANRLLTLTNRNGGTPMSSYSYTLDNVGNRTQVVDTTGTSTYSYDDLYRLTGVTYPNSDTQSYTYDAMGNRLTKVNNGNTTNYSYDDADQMTLADGVTYSYDNDGNQTAAGSDTFGWDAENRLSGATVASVSGTYAYNGDGLRTTRTIGGSGSAFVWDQNANLPVILQDSAGNRYVYGLDLLTRINGTSEEWYLADGLGSTTGLSDGAGGVTGSYAYDVVGAVRAQTGATTEWSYTGEQNDPTGLQYLRARYYDAATGRFLTQDPLPLLQRYAYVGNNPATFVDPSGFCERNWNILDKLDCPVEGAKWAFDYAKSPWNQAQFVQNVGYTLAVTCGTIVVCGVAAFFTGWSWQAKLKLICDDIAAGKLSVKEGSKKFLISLVPSPGTTQAPGAGVVGGKLLEKALPKDTWFKPLAGCAK